MKKKINIAIIGLGNIGSYLYKYLLDNEAILTKKTNVIPNVLYISAKNKLKKRNIKIKKNLWINNYMNAVNDKKVDS
jgi:homoserine dehydrogenase